MEKITIRMMDDCTVTKEGLVRRFWLCLTCQWKGKYAAVRGDDPVCPECSSAVIPRVTLELFDYCI